MLDLFIDVILGCSVAKDMVKVEDLALFLQSILPDLQLVVTTRLDQLLQSLEVVLDGFVGLVVLLQYWSYSDEHSDVALVSQILMQQVLVILRVVIYFPLFHLLHSTSILLLLQLSLLYFQF